MARWRAVPTAVSTAVGALAFLASTGLAIVLGAGLHVWSGPTAPTGIGAHGVAPAAPVTGRVGGVVTVAPPATSPGHPTSTSTSGPAAALPFVPFLPAAPAPVAVPPAPKASGPGPTSPDAVGTPTLTGPRDVRVGLRSLEALLLRLRGVDLTSGDTKSLRSTSRVRTEDSKPGKHGHRRGHPAAHRDAHRPLPHGVAVSDDRDRDGGSDRARAHGHPGWSHGAHGWSHGHRHGHGHRDGDGHRHGHGRSHGHGHD